MVVADNLRSSKILVVEDEPGIVALLEFILDDAGYENVISTTDPRQAVDLFLSFSPDLILLDLHMPHKSGLEVMWDLREHVAESYVPVLMLTGDISQEAKVRALATGAKDFLQKPYDNTEVRLRIRNLLETRHLYLALQGQNEHLEEVVRKRTTELETAKVEILQRLALAAEFRDDQT
jgi:putative two-component system response regulator